MLSLKREIGLRKRSIGHFQQNKPELNWREYIVKDLCGQALEEGELEKRCTTEELWKINHFIALLAKKGVLPSEINEECILGNDIQELLYGDDIYEYFFYCDQG